MGYFHEVFHSNSLHSNMERFIRNKHDSIRGDLYIPIWRDSYSGFTTILCIKQLRRCCLHYNYAFNFQISSKETQKTRKRGYHHLNHKVQMKLAPRRSSIKESSTEYFGYIFCFFYQEID